MKNYSKISVILLIICVFGADGHRAERVTVMEGDSLTLDPLTEQFNRILWWFGDPLAFIVESFGIDLVEEYEYIQLSFGNPDSFIAEINGNVTSYTEDERLRDRLKLNNQTGSLTINNMRITDTGVYHLQIDHSTGTLFKTFIVKVPVFGADGDEMKSVSVKEGDSVTLDTGFKEESDVITWWFKSSLIVESDENGTYTDDETFGDRLELNYETGSLTINNMTISDSGNYHLEINHNNRTLSKIFRVTVHVFGADEEVKRESVKEGDSVTLDPGFKEEFNHINWLFGDSDSDLDLFISKSDGNEISYTDDERFRDRLSLNHQTGSLTINNMRVTDSGIYKVEIDHSKGSLTVTFMVNVCGSFYPYPGLSPGAKAGIGVVILLLVLYIAAVLYYHHKISKR